MLRSVSGAGSTFKTLGGYHLSNRTKAQLTNQVHVRKGKTPRHLLLSIRNPNYLSVLGGPGVSTTGRREGGTTATMQDTTHGGEDRTDLDQQLERLELVWTRKSNSKSQDGRVVGIDLDYLDQILLGGYTRGGEPCSLASRYLSTPATKFGPNGPNRESPRCRYAVSSWNGLVQPAPNGGPTESKELPDRVGAAREVIA